MTEFQTVQIGPRPPRHVQLTRTQAQIWTSQRLQPDAALANMGYRIRLSGMVEPRRLARAFDTVVRASEVLRMVVVDGSAPSARILPEPPMSTEVVDVSVGDVAAWAAARVDRPIDATTCVYDSVLLRHADDDWTWWLDLHHVATDAWSSNLVFRATALAYEADDGDVARLADVIDGSFCDLHVEPDPERAAGWTAVIDDSGPHPPLAPYGPRGARTTAVEPLPVPVDAASTGRALTGDYRTISRDLGLLTMSAMTVAQAVGRLDGRDTVVMGVPVHHRSTPATRRVVGPLMELYPLVVTLDEQETNRDMFRRVHRAIVSLLRRAKPGESPGGGFEVVLNVFTADYGDFAGIPTDVEWVRSGHVEPSHVVRSQVSDHAGEVRWELDVNSGLSTHGAWRRLPDHARAIVTGIIERPDAKWPQVALIGETEQRDLSLVEVAEPVPPPTTPVHEQVRARLVADADWVVAEQNGQTISAVIFDRRADDLARSLAHVGVRPGSTVGLRMRRSIDVLIAIHAVLRAGAAFVMLDPDDPRSRHDTIAADANLATILDELPGLSGDEIEWDPPSVDLDDLAYILYTSGSTGVPKGVPITHRGLADYLRFAADTYVDHDAPVVALHSALVFDLTITSLFLSFLTGGRTVVFADEPLVALGNVAHDDRITVLKATPSQLELFTRLADEPRPLRSIIVGGEAFRRPIADRLLACAPGARVFNEYGPTEAVVGCMIHEYDPAVDIGPDVPTGRAASGCLIRIVDELGQRTAMGAWGELAVHRSGMATGYLNRPDLSAGQFVDLDADGRIWYRTGDRVRVERPGAVTYGGRMDDQVKVNGVRLEPAEVEAALVDHPEVENAMVRVWSPSLRSTGEVFRCVRCGLGADVLGVTFDVDGVCDVCHSYDAVEPQTRAWFKTEADLDERLDEVRARSDGDIDCLHLLSGGKDSTYALYQLVERGWRVHALTLDNGFISDGAKENIRRSVADLGITHEFATTDAMNEIFRDSLDRYSNVCQGCYKTIYTIAVARARELGIPVVVTGLSRGQFFETRLVPHQFEDGRFDPDAIDRTVLEARRVYHHTTDAVTELLPEQAVFDDPDIFDHVEFLDYYRYVDVDLADVYRFLDERAPWVRPADTGRSTNCLINVAGIQVHRHEQGFHNYAEPYSWDVRLGHKTRDEALEELDDDVDDVEVERLLAEVGYRPKTNEVLTAWYRSRSGADLAPDELRSHLRRLLPEHAVPSAFVRIDEIPMAASAKADASLLPPPTRFHRQGGARVEPSTPVERRLAEIWSDVLGLESVGATDDFFDLGGASLAALEVVAAVDEEFGTDLHDASVFRARTIRELATLVEAATPSAPAASARIPSLSTSPLSAGEESMLFEYRSDPTSTRYNVTRLYTMRGDVDLDRLAAAIRDVAMAHGPLHTSYGADRVRFGADRAVSFEVVPIDDGDAFARFADVQRTVPFDLDDGPLVRVHAAHTGPAELSLLIGLHHITIDAGTFDLFWSQIADRYAGGSLVEPTSTYAEHGAWQRAVRPPESERFWLDQAIRRRPTRQFGTAAPSPPVGDGFVSRQVDLRPAELTGAGGTAFAASMAATAATLSAFVADDTVEFGITASAKDHAAAAPLVGYYLNTLPVGLDVDRSASFEALVARAGASVTEMLPHRTYPFASIVRDARAAGHELPNVAFMLAFEALATPRLADAEVSQRILASGTAIADVSLIVQERADSVEIGVEYRGTVLDGPTATRLLDAFESVLVGGLRRPGTAIGELLEPHLAADLVGDDLGEVDGTVLDRFTRWVSAQPDAIAVVAGESSITYAELAGRVAALIERIEAGGPARRVGVAVERSIDLVVAVLAAQFTGAAYVPIDPSTGSDRLRRILREARVDRLVVRAGGDTYDVAPEQVVEVTADRSASAPAELAARADTIGADRAAYVIFTSGSTGRPRGVEVSHANLAASTAARSVWYERDPERFLVTSSIGFDSSVVGLFWTLTTGGAIVLPSDDEVHDVDRLGDLAARHGVSHVLMVPSLYGALLDRRAHRLRNLSVAIVAGEACPESVVTRHERALPGVQLVNEYGPSEATVWASAHRLSAHDGWTPIGRPIPGVTIRIADPAVGPVPNGVLGELAIAGPTVTNGYVDDPAASDAQFVERDGRRWYRTGDLARIRDGLIDFVGRVDDQLNVGGIRLEPAEVERELRRRPEIREAVVVAAGDPPTVTAHVEVDGTLDERAIRHDLADALPPGSVPRQIVAWPALPRSPHGKLDRAAIAELPVADGHEDRSAAGRSSDVLGQVIDAWDAALRRSDVGPDTEFFDVGGDSLAAVEIVTRLGDSLGRTVDIGTLLSAPTPRRLAEVLDNDAGAPRSHDEFRLVALRPGVPDGPLVIMTPAWDDVFSYQALAGTFDETTTVLALSYTEQTGRSVVTTVDELVTSALPIVATAVRGRHHAAVVGWSVGGVVAVELAERLHDTDTPVDFVALIDTFFPGQHRHLWSNRWWKYKSMLRPGAFGAAVGELGTMAGRRVKRFVGKVGRRLLIWSGTELPDEPERTSVGGVPVAALDHPLASVATRMVFYSATTTNPQRTVEAWRPAVRDLTVVPVAGRHRGFDSVMAVGRVEPIGDDLAARLSPPDD